MNSNKSIMDHLIAFFSLVPLILYTIVAILLTVIAVFSVWDALQLIAQMILTRDFANGLVSVIYALLLTITIIVLFETVTVYFKTKHVEVRALLIAGLTGMVRHVLIYNVSTVDPAVLFGTVALLAVLIAGIVLVKPESLA
ncbi:MAG: phosphate-starvation-inducible PsiE family protein [Methanoregula sp.]|nr:phosphate-starvation-inducible PsiE family protein [Methanoregula sp.]